MPSTSSAATPGLVPALEAVLPGRSALRPGSALAIDPAKYPPLLFQGWRRLTPKTVRKEGMAEDVSVTCNRPYPTVSQGTCSGPPSSAACGLVSQVESAFHLSYFG